MEVVALSDVCEIVGGGTPSKRNEAYYTGTIPWATVRDMNVDVISNTDFCITEEAVKASSTNVIPGGNVVIATRVGLGKVCVLERDTAINQDLRGLIPKRSGIILPQYLFYWYKTVAPTVVAAGKGATVQGVKVDFVKSLQLPLPPLREQKRIVAILDEAFAAIDKATENAEKNLANARELFLGYLDGAISRNDSGWDKTSLGKEIDLLTGFAFKSKDYTESADGTPLIRGDNIVQGCLRCKRTVTTVLQ